MARSPRTATDPELFGQGATVEGPAGLAESDRFLRRPRLETRDTSHQGGGGPHREGLEAGDTDTSVPQGVLRVEGDRDWANDRMLPGRTPMDFPR